MNKAVFLDKDTILVKESFSGTDQAAIILHPDAPQALRCLQEQGYTLFIVANHPGIAMGHFSEADVQRSFLAICKLLRPHGVRLDGFYYCPHDIHGKQWPYVQACHCSKPAPGMLLKAAAEHGIELGASWMIGNTANDVEAGHRAQCKTVLIGQDNASALPTFEATNLTEAAALIVKQAKHYQAA